MAARRWWPMASTADEVANAVPAIDRDGVDREPGLHDLRRGTHAGASGSGVRRPGDRRATRPGSDLVTLAVCSKIVAAIVAFSSNVPVRRNLYCKRPPRQASGRSPLRPRPLGWARARAARRLNSMNIVASDGRLCVNHHSTRLPRRRRGQQRFRSRLDERLRVGRALATPSVWN